MSLTVAIDDKLFLAKHKVSGSIAKTQAYSYAINCLARCLLLEYDPQIFIKISHNVQ